MSTIDSHRPLDALGDDGEATHDLIIFRGDRIVFHDHCDTPRQRLELCVRLLTCAEDFRQVDPREVQAVMHRPRFDEDPDIVLNEIAKLCRRWDVNIYVSTTRKRPARSAQTQPERLFSVITDYGSGHVISEHFTTRRLRRDELVARAEQFFDGPARLPEAVLTDDNRLAALIAAFLAPATVSLTESVRDPSGSRYMPAGGPLPVR